jgi:hypothetical protein
MADGGKQPARTPARPAPVARASVPAAAPAAAHGTGSIGNLGLQQAMPAGPIAITIGVAAPGGRPSARAAARADRIEFRSAEPPPSLVRHELAHVAQARQPGPGAPWGSAALESEAGAVAASSGPVAVRGRHAGGWLYDDPPRRGAADLRRELGLADPYVLQVNEALGILSDNARPDHMAALRASYGPSFFADLRRAFNDTQWGRARGYLGNQLTLAEIIETHTGLLIQDVGGIMDALQRWPDDDVLRMIEDEAANASLPAPAPGSDPAATALTPAPARASWHAVQSALAGALTADEQYRATQLMFTKAERARGTRPPTAGRPADAVATLRVGYAYSRIEAAEAANRPRDAFLALADLNAAQRTQVLVRLNARSNWPNLGAVIADLRGIAAERDDAAALERALSRGASGTGEISPAMLEHAAGRAGEMIRQARARVRLPPASLAPEALAQYNAEVTALEARFHSQTLLQSLYFASHETADATYTALGVPAHLAAQFTINRVSNFTELLAFLRRIPPAHRLEVTQSVWYQAKVTQVMSISPDPAQSEVLCAALYEGNETLAASEPGREMRAVLDSYDIKRAWEARDRTRMWTLLSRMPAERRTRLAGHRRMTALLATMHGGNTEAMAAASQLQRGLAGEADALLRQEAIHLVVRNGRPTFVIGDARAYIELINRDPAAQADLRRGMVLARRAQDDPALVLSVPEQALADRYRGLLEALAQIDDHELKESLRNVAFGEPDLTSTAGGGNDPTSEAHYLHLRLEDRLTALRPGASSGTRRASGTALRPGASSATDLISWAGPAVDEHATRFRLLYERRRRAGFGSADLIELADLYYRAMQALDAFAPANRAFASTAAMMVAAVAGTVVVTALSGGTLGPVAVAATAAFVGGAAAGLTGYAIRGESTTAEVLTDVATGTVEGAVAIASAALAARLVHGATAGRAAGQAARAASGGAVRAATGGAGAAIAEGIIDGAIGGAAGELFQTAIDEATWNRGVAAAIAALLAGVARGAAMGAAGGLVGGLIGHAISKVAATLGSAETRSLQTLLEAATLPHPERLSVEALTAIQAANRLARAGDIDGAQAALRAVTGLASADAEALESAMRRMHILRSAADIGEQDAAALMRRFTELDDSEFLRRAPNRDAHAVVNFEGGAPHVYVRRGSPPAAVREEIEHLLQWHGDPLMRARMAEVAGVTEAGWRGMAPAERARVAREALIVEADAQRRIMGRVEGRGASGDALANAEWLAAEEALFDINRRIGDLDAALANPATLDARALRLDGPNPPRFYASTPQAVAVSDSAAAAATRQRFVGTRRTLNRPDGTVDEDLVRELQTAGYVIHRRDGRVLRVQRPPNQRAADLPHLALGADGALIEGRAGFRSHEDMRADAELAWRARQEGVVRLRADVAANRLAGDELARARRLLDSRFGTFLDGLINGGSMNAGDAGLLLGWAPLVDELAQRMSKAPGDLRAVAALPRTAGGMTDGALSSFRRTLRGEVADFIHAVPDGAERMRALQYLLDLAPDNRTRGELFTAFRQRQWAQAGGTTRVMGADGNPVSPTFDFPEFGTSGRRTADDLVDFAVGNGHLPPGRYAIEDKFGDAFDPAQARDYARTWVPGRGLRRSPNGSEPDFTGLVYVFSSSAKANDALRLMRNDPLVSAALGRSPGGIHVAHYEPGGALRFSTTVTTTPR